MRRAYIIGVFSAIAILCSPISNVYAQEVVKGAFVVRPAKIEYSAGPGEKRDREIVISNGTDVPLEITLVYYDVSPKSLVSGGEQQTMLVEKGTHSDSIGKYLSFPSAPIRLLSNTEVKVPISLSFPKSELPGGKYGAIAVRAKPALGSTSGSNMITFNQEIIVSLYARIQGEVKQEGKLTNFSLGESIFVPESSEEFPIIFQTTFKNSGSIYLNPYGKITVRGLFKQDEMYVDPWSVYPGAERTRDVAYIKHLLPGVYRATIELNRGYNDEIDTQTINFVVIPRGITWLWLLAVILLVALLVRKSLRISKNTVV